MEEGFKKFEFSSEVPTQKYSNNTNNSGMKKRRFKKIFKSKPARIAGVVLLILVVFFGFLGFKAWAIYGDAKQAKAQAQIAADALKQQNVIVAKDELVKTKEELIDLQNNVDSIAFVQYIPLIGGYYSDGKHGVDAAVHGVDAAIITTESLIPYADVLGLKGDSSFVAGSAEDRIRLAVKTMGKVVPKIDDIEKELVLAQEDIQEINPNRYPNFWKFKQVREQIEQLQVLANEGVVAVEEGKPLIKVLPELLGETDEKKYLVIFQNDKELRSTGGFMTFYAVFKVKEGVISVDSASDIYDLDASISNHPDAPEIIDKYLPNVNEFYIRDSNLSPDFGESMKQFNELYEDSSGPQDIDGIIAIDTHFLVSVLEILGDVEAGGITFNASNDPRCDCPQAVYILEENTTRPVNYVRDNRKALLGELLFATMKKALSSSPKEYWGRLMQAAVKDANEKHILFALNNKDAQKGIDALGWGGKVEPFEGDYVNINDANLGGQKSNLYVQQSVRMDYNVSDSGEINKTVLITYKNPKPHSDCNLERGGLCLNATLRDFQRVYVPEGSSLESSKGSEVKVETKKDLGKTVFESFFTVKPLGKSEITYNYKLPFKLADDSILPVLIQKQPGTDVIPYEIYVNGKQVEKFDLVADKELMLEI